MRERVLAARNRQRARQGHCNAALSDEALAHYCPLDDGNRELLAQATERLGLSPRALKRCLRVALTLADLAGVPAPGRAQLVEALSYRH
ncbi:MG(2+) CHELATASE FAMILY PROTEIN / ComM-related protein [Pseudohaliea rubra DSM 19751]|uniref:MG(2+) CHELATASE FAMILY PROTEIN / ComM-related protein n=1 Tax=Pseudohaliea rubra DSM 19751 TaxID=1265313 RepID=A0A095VUV9_9GAMM|nr:MG(2+) CHELATASE FAMILY PROTEIN / ComM-related protein [Pseudohaliea rubra DSM 19751]